MHTCYIVYGQLCTFHLSSVAQDATLMQGLSNQINYLKDTD